MKSLRNAMFVPTEEARAEMIMRHGGSDEMRRNFVAAGAFGPPQLLSLAWRTQEEIRLLSVSFWSRWRAR